MSPPILLEGMSTYTCNCSDVNGSWKPQLKVNPPLTKPVCHRLSDTETKTQFLRYISGHKNITKLQNKDPKLF